MKARVELAESRIDNKQTPSVQRDDQRHSFHLFFYQSPVSPSSSVAPPASSSSSSDADRQRALRERARKLIEEARSGINKPEVPGIAAMTEDARRRKEEMTARSKGDVDVSTATSTEKEGSGETPKPDLRLKKIMLTRPELAVTMATTAAKLGTNDSEGGFWVGG